MQELESEMEGMVIFTLSSRSQSRKCSDFGVEFPVLETYFFSILDSESESNRFKGQS